MGGLEFSLAPVIKKPKRAPRRISSGSEEKARLNLTREELQSLVKKYDQESPFWVSEEKRIGDQIRKEKQFGMDTLKEIVHWKFLDLPGREKRVNNHLKQHTNEDVRKITGWILPLSTNEDRKRVEGLRMLKGIGVSLASVILTFYNPQDYCVYDIHVMREVYGKEPKYMFTSSRHYLRLLNDLREYSTRVNLPVRTIEKALFRKNLG